MRLSGEGTAYYPHELLPVVRFLNIFRPGNRLVVRTLGGDVIGSATETPEEPWAPDGFLRFVADVARIQSASGQYHKIDSGLGDVDLAEVSRGGRLLEGEAVEGTWTNLRFTLAADATAATRRELSGVSFPFRLVTTEPEVVTVGGYRHAIGVGLELSFESARLPDDDAERLQSSVAGEAFELELVPAETNRVSYRLR